MGKTRHPLNTRRATAALAAVLAVTTACGALSEAQPRKQSGAARASVEPSPILTGPSSIVALGDSVPAGTACNCTPFPELTATDLSTGQHVAVTAYNRAVGGFTTSDVMHQLTTDTAIMGEVSSANVLELEVGANDVAYSATCGTKADCYTPQIEQMQQNLQAVVQRLRELSAAHPVAFVLLDYWSVWLGGQYAKAQGEAYVAAAATVTERVDAAIKTVAAETGSIYVDLRAAFKGPDYDNDETQYLASDGDHPNAAGHAKIAQAVTQAVQSA